MVLQSIIVYSSKNHFNTAWLFLLVPTEHREGLSQNKLQCVCSWWYLDDSFVFLWPSTPQPESRPYNTVTRCYFHMCINAGAHTHRISQLSANSRGQQSKTSFLGQMGSWKQGMYVEPHVLEHVTCGNREVMMLGFVVYPTDVAHKHTHPHFCLKKLLNF